MSLSQTAKILAAKCLTNKHSEDLLLQLNEFRKQEQFTDVTLICNDTRIAAHRNILAASSPYFMAMFSGNFPESKQSEIQIQEMDCKCLQLAIEFIYTGCVDVHADCVQQLLITASYLQLQHMADLCAAYMVGCMDAENCLGFKLFAEKQNNCMLLKAADAYIVTHFKKVVQSDEFFEMTYAEVAAILADDKLYVHSDDAVLSGLARWAAHKPEERLTHLAFLLRFVHPACVTADVARSLPILQQDAESRKWLCDVLHCSKSMEWRIFVLDKMGRRPDMHRFDVQFDNVIELKPLPKAVFAPSLAAYKNILYVQGGSSGHSTSDSYYYNVYRDQWFELTSLDIERSHHRSLVLQDTLYALGGKTLKGATSTVESLNLVTNEIRLKKNMLSNRCSMGAVASENCLYVMGGETDSRSLYSAERFDPRIGEWQELPSMRKVNSYCSSAVIDDSIYCCEGLGSCMERFDLRANKWDIVDFWEEREFYEIFAVDNRLFSVSGETIAHYIPDVNKWETVYTFPESREWDTAVGMQMMEFTI